MIPVRFCLIAMIIAGAVSRLDAATMTLSPVADTTLSEASAGNNLGGEAFLSSGLDDNAQVSRALLKFNIAGNVPSNATIQSVTLTLTVAHSTALTSSSFSLHRTLQDWGEGSKTNGNNGGPAGSGEATWSARFYPATLWSVAGGGSPVDYVATPSASQYVTTEGSYNFGSTSALLADVQAWLTNSAVNFGWFLISEDEFDFDTAQLFASREDTANSPKLVIEYTLPPRPHLSIIASADTSLLEPFPDNNAGTAALFAGGIGNDLPRSRALMEFSTEDIPAGAVLTSATLNLSVYELLDDGTAHTSTFDLHRMLRAWFEGNKGTYVDTFYYGDTADIGETTWNAMSFPNNLWNAPGGAAATDYSTAISSQVVISGFGTYSFTNLLADVQYWLAHPAENHGWILISEQESILWSALRFSSREDSNPTNAPTLVLEYIPVPKIYRTEVSGNQFKLYFVTELGLASQVQYRDSLFTGNWTTLTNLPPLSVTKTNVISTPLAGPQRFYRVSVQ